MKNARRFLVPLAAAVCAAGSLAAAPARAADYSVGQAQISIAGPGDVRGDQSRLLHVIVWYPGAANAPMEPMVQGPPGTPFFAEGVSAPDAAIVASPRTFPLIVVSHGTGSDAAQMGWLAAGLAARGYIVAAVMHPGDNALAPKTLAGLTMGWLRAGDLSRTIDAVLDRERIGAAGYSHGGYTVLELAGARTDLTALASYCAKRPSVQVCTGEASGQGGIRQAAAAFAQTDAAFAEARTHAGDSYRDPRVKAVFSLAPALGPELTAQSLRAITIPVEIVAGLADPVLPVEDNAIPDAAAIPHAQLELLARPIAHYTFLTQCAPAGTAMFGALCADTGAVRAAAHEETIALARSFFAAELAR